MTKAHKIGIAALIVLLLGVIGSNDMQAEVDGEEYYCEQAAAGVWPDRDYCDKYRQPIPLF